MRRSGGSQYRNARRQPCSRQRRDPRGRARRAFWQDGAMTAETPVNAVPRPPAAKKLPVERTHHGDTFTDSYEWLREKDNPEVSRHLTAENAYTEAVTRGQEQLREDIFTEIKNRTQETDLSVPARKKGWWYYSRTEEGKQYGIQCRVAAVDTGDLNRDWTPPEVVPGRPVTTSSPARRQRRGRGQAFLFDRRPCGQRGRNPPCLLRGQRRRRAVHAARQGPQDREAPARRGGQRLLRPRLLPRRHAGLLHRRRRFVAALPG
jgi:hypothetical protein